MCSLNYTESFWFESNKNDLVASYFQSSRRTIEYRMHIVIHTVNILMYNLRLHILEIRNTIVD